MGSGSALSSFKAPVRGCDDAGTAVKSVRVCHHFQPCSGSGKYFFASEPQFLKKIAMDSVKTSRREFVKTVAAGGAGLALGSISAKSYGRIIGANDRIGYALIGLGNISRSHLARHESVQDQAQFVGVCDIYKPRLERGMQVTGAPGYHDYQDLLARDEVDAVIICTPDHWHAPMAIDAMQAGKDVLCEKPMCLNPDEARKMVRTAEETGRVLGIDSEHTSHGIWLPAQKVVRSGILGNLIWSQTSRSRNTGDEVPWNYKIDEGISPQNLDWDRWLGSTKKVPFSKERYFRWRRYWEYGGGITTDLYFHHIAPLIKVTGPAFPNRATAAGGHFVFTEEEIEVPDTFMMTLTFPHQTMLVGGSLANSAELPIVVRGHEANLFFYGNHLRPDYFIIEPEAHYEDGFREKVESLGLDGKWIEVEDGRNTRPAFRFDAPPRENMTENFLKCMRTREKPDLDGELGYMTQVAVSLAVASFRQNKVMFFDKESGQVLDHPPTKA